MRGRLATSRCCSRQTNSFLYDAFVCWLVDPLPNKPHQKQRHYHATSSPPEASPSTSPALIKKHGFRLVDYIQSGDLPIQASQGKLRSQHDQPRSDSFDVYNSSASASSSILQPKRIRRRQHQLQPQLVTSSPGGVQIDNLEKATILALRLQQVKNGQYSLEDLAQFARTLFETSHKSAVNEILALVPQSTPNTNRESNTDKNNSNIDISENVDQLVYQPIANESQRMARVLRALERHGFTKQDLDRWIECISAPQLHAALEVMDQGGTTTTTGPTKWPKFLILFTLRRYCNSRLSASSLARWFSQQYPLYDSSTQAKMLFRVLQDIQKWVPDLVPAVCQVAMDSAQPDLFHGTTGSALLNQLLWQVARFGRAASDTRETSFIMRAQSIIVDRMSKAGVALDSKGYLAVGYVLRHESPDRAAAFLDAIKRHDYPYSVAELRALNQQPDHQQHQQQEEQSLHQEANQDQLPYLQGVFPYLHGPTCLEILLSLTGDQALTAFDTIIKPNSIQWAILLRQLRRLNELTPDMMQALWTKIQAMSSPNAISPYLLSQVIMGFGSLETARNIVHAYPEYMTNAVALTYLKTACRDTTSGGNGLNEARQLLCAMDYKPVSAYNALLAGELYNGDPTKMWDIYSSIQGEPDIWTLYYACKAAASDPTLVWNGLYAAQRMVVEFKHWVRGAYIDGGDTFDLLKLYPSDQLFYMYILMLGRSGYSDDLLEVLPWMQRLGLEPSKMSLCALITYSPNGKYLQKHGQVSGTGEKWPTEFELRQFQNNESKRV